MPSSLRHVRPRATWCGCFKEPDVPSTFIFNSSYCCVVFRKNHIKWVASWQLLAAVYWAFSDFFMKMFLGTWIFLLEGKRISNDPNNRFIKASCFWDCIRYEKTISFCSFTRNNEKWLKLRQGLRNSNRFVSPVVYLKRQCLVFLSERSQIKIMFTKINAVYNCAKENFK